MVERPWRSYAEATLDREYVALVSYLPLKHFWKVPSFLRMVGAVQDQLGESKGLIGYSVMAKFLRRRFWTLSVWEDEKALMEFVTNVPHKDIMISLKGMLTDTKFVRWIILAQLFLQAGRKLSLGSRKSSRVINR